MTNTEMVLHFYDSRLPQSPLEVSESVGLELDLIMTAPRQLLKAHFIEAVGEPWDPERDRKGTARHQRYISMQTALVLDSAALARARGA